MNERQMYICDDLRTTLHTVSNNLWNTRDRIEDDKTDHVPIREDEHNALEPLYKRGCTLVGVGCGRLILRLSPNDYLDKFVVKLGRYGNTPTSIGMFQNNNEVTLWRSPESDTLPLLPIFDWQEGPLRWLVMPYGTPLDSESISPEVRQKYTDTIVNAVNGTTIDEVELVPSNMVLWNDNVWLADYGVC